ncbi:MAG: nucleoside triphosphate pyrophosphohydrolase [Ignavibacteria bacterium]|jgi:XTP/dITP diphosphohydrolase
MTGEKFKSLMDIMYKLRKECPWDREQTNDSIKANTIEEAFEVVEAIDENNFDELKKELGDLLLHIVFHSVIAEEENHFNINDVIDAISEKLIRRHPHVFGETKVDGSKEVMKNWETLKLKEGRESVLEGVPKNLPGLHRAFRLQEKASKVGFDWEKKEDVWKKVEEEINELKESEKKNDIKEIENEVGDILFSITNYSRFIGINPENALRLTIEKFIKRFTYVEKKVKEQNKEIHKVTLEEMDKYWDESKNSK